MTPSPFRRLVFGALRRLLYLWVRSETINQSSLTLNLDRSRPVFYVLQSPSLTELAVVDAECSKAGLPRPVFEETVAGFRVNLRGRGADLVSAEPAPRWGNRRLNPRQERALAYLAEHNSITNREFRELCPELSDETIRRELSDLVDQGLIVKVGERKATYYILK